MGINFGESYESATPRETKAGVENLGQSLAGFTQGKGFEGLYGDVGRLTSGAAQNWLSGLGQFDTAAATNALLNPEPYNFKDYFAAHAGERSRQMQDAYGNAAVYGGGMGNRFSTGTNRLMSESAGQLTEGWAQTDAAALLQDLARMDQARATGLTAFNQLGMSGVGAVDALLGRIMQYLAPGEAIYDPGFIRELVPALISGGAYVAGKPKVAPAAGG